MTGLEAQSMPHPILFAYKTAMGGAVFNLKDHNLEASSANGSVSVSGIV